MKFELPPNTDRTVDTQPDPTPGVAFDVTSRLGYTGDDFPHQLNQIKEALGVLQQTAPTPEARAAMRAFASTIINANKEPAAVETTNETTLPTSNPGNGGAFFDPSKFRGGGDGQ